MSAVLRKVPFSFFKKLVTPCISSKTRIFGPIVIVANTLRMSATMGNSNKISISANSGTGSKKTVSDPIQERKEHFLNMPLEEKRSQYRCKKYVLVNEIKSWKEHGPTVKEKHSDVAPMYTVNEELNTKISLWTGDITTLEIDAIINAANKSLLGGGGVDGCIHRMAGSHLYDECKTLEGCNTGNAKLSGGYRLPAKYVIHTVGPIGEQKEKLSSCYRRCLDIAKENEFNTIAFPCISTGIYGYDIEKATPVVMETVRDWLAKQENLKIERIIFCVFLKGDVAVYEENLLQYFPVETFEDNKIRQTKAKKKTKQGSNDSPIGKKESVRNSKTEDDKDKKKSKTEVSKIDEVKARKENESKQSEKQERTKDAGKTGTNDKMNQNEPSKPLSATKNINVANKQSVTADSQSKQREIEDNESNQHENKLNDEKTLASKDADHPKKSEASEAADSDKAGDDSPEKKKPREETNL